MDFAVTPLLAGAEPASGHLAWMLVARAMVLLMTPALAGYSLAFGDGGRWIGSLEHLFLNGVDLEAHGNMPHLLFMAFQGTFAIITAALTSGAIASFPSYFAIVRMSRTHTDDSLDVATAQDGTPAATEPV